MSSLTENTLCLLGREEKWSDRFLFLPVCFWESLESSKGPSASIFAGRGSRGAVSRWGGVLHCTVSVRAAVGVRRAEEAGRVGRARTGPGRVGRDLGREKSGWGGTRGGWGEAEGESAGPEAGAWGWASSSRGNAGSLRVTRTGPGRSGGSRASPLLLEEPTAATLLRCSCGW